MKQGNITNFQNKDIIETLRYLSPSKKDIELNLHKNLEDFFSKIYNLLDRQFNKVNSELSREEITKFNDFRELFVKQESKEFKKDNNDFISVYNFDQLNYSTWLPMLQSEFQQKGGKLKVIDLQDSIFGPFEIPKSLRFYRERSEEERFLRQYKKVLPLQVIEDWNQIFVHYDEATDGANRIEFIKNMILTNNQVTPSIITKKISQQTQFKNVKLLNNNQILTNFNHPACKELIHETSFSCELDFEITQSQIELAKLEANNFYLLSNILSLVKQNNASKGISLAKRKLEQIISEASLNHSFTQVAPLLDTPKTKRRK